MILSETYTLANGVQIPKLGLGTWLIDDDKAAQSVRDAVNLGYRHIDTAQGYGNERGVGEGVRTCGLSRKEIFVTTKLDACLKTYESAKAGIDGSLQKMGIDYIDLMIIHSPQPWTDYREGKHFFDGNREAWRAMEEAYKNGKLRAIGVSNFEKVDLDNLLEHGTVGPMVNQILAHVSNTPFELIDYAKSKGILVEAYSPVGHGEVLKNKEVASMAERYGVTVPQLCIRYCLQLGLLPLPKTANLEHMKVNAAVDFEISAGDMDALKNVERIKNYGEASLFPVYGGKAQGDGTYIPRDFENGGK
jgi:diketogulonate reductase-like aldo/keto reductase